MRRVSARALTLVTIIAAVVMLLLSGSMQFQSRPLLILAQDAPTPPCNHDAVANVSVAVDISEDVDPKALRRIALSRAVKMSHGYELLLIATNVKGSVLTLNALLNFDALGFTHQIVLAHDNETCAVLGDAIGRLLQTPKASSAARLQSTPCMHDSSWETWLSSPGKLINFGSRQGAQLQRWRAFARLVRLGYNVLTMDVDAVLLEDPYPHLQSRALCGRFSLMYASEAANEYQMRQVALQNGIVYSCGSRRDGAAAWVVAEVVDRMLRLIDACEGVFGESEGTACSGDTWLRAARADEDFLFDQMIHFDVVQSAVTRDGGHWWRVAGRLIATAWPFHVSNQATNETSKLVQNFWAGMDALPNYVNASLPSKARCSSAPRAGAAKGIAISGTTDGRPRHWHLSPLIDEDAAKGADISQRWSARFALKRGSLDSVVWAPISAAMPLATAMIMSAGSVIDEAYARLAREHAVAWASANYSQYTERRASLPGPAMSRAEFSWSQNYAWHNQYIPAAMQAQRILRVSPVGALPSARGQLSRAWQRTLQTDWAASQCEAAPDGETRRTIPDSLRFVRDGEHGATWAPTPEGDEAVGLLPGWLACHWTVARLGLGGTTLPMTVIFHVTNANDKMLALAAHGYLHYEAFVAEAALSAAKGKNITHEDLAAAQGQSRRWECRKARGGRSGRSCGYTAYDRVKGSIERRIWADGMRPTALAFRRELLPTYSNSLGTNLRGYLDSVIEPLLIGALATRRLALLPTVPCNTSSWLRPTLRGQGGNMPASWAYPPNISSEHRWGQCRTGACSFRTYAVGTVSADEARLQAMRARRFQYVSPFGKRAQRLAAGALQCVPLPGALGSNALSGRRCKTGAGGYLLHGPVAEEYLSLLKAAAQPPLARHVILHAGIWNGSVVEISYSAFIRALSEATQSKENGTLPPVLYLPSRVRLHDVPAAVRNEVQLYCS